MEFLEGKGGLHKGRPAHVHRGDSNRTQDDMRQVPGIPITAVVGSRRVEAMT